MKKQQLKGLKDLAKMLPESKELQKYSIVKLGSQLSNEEIDNSKIDIELDKAYVKRGNFRIVDVDHFNRLKKAFARNKEQGLADYIDWVDMNNKRMNALFEKLELERVSKELMEISKKGGKGFWSNLMNFLLSFVSVFSKK